MLLKVGEFGDVFSEVGEVGFTVVKGYFFCFKREVLRKDEAG
jgi:hypothetical protein